MVGICKKMFLYNFDVLLQALHFYLRNFIFF